ncbi:TldD/PmbA family protein [Candidatus Latescibacterota bacterium]
MIEKLLETAKRKADSAEVFLEETSEIAVSFESDILKSVERKNAFGLGLRVIHEGRIGFSSSTDPHRIDEMVDMAVACSRFGKEIQFEFPGNAEICDVSTFDPAIETFSPEIAVQEGNRTVEMLKELYPKGLTYTEFSSTISTVRIINSSGLDISYRDTDFSQYITLVIVDGDSILMINDGGHFGTLDMRTDKYVKNVADLAVKAETKAPKTSGLFPVIFTARKMPELLKSIEMGVDGRRLLKGDSPLIGKSGEKILGNVTITDDPCMNHAPGSRPFDDEGVFSKTNILFKDGVYQDFLFDLDTAAKTGHSPTSSATRGMLSLPSIGTTNMILSGGTSSLDEMISLTDTGIFVYGVLGGGQSNLLAGDFSLNIMLGFLIKNGEIAGRLPDTMLSGNIYSAFGNISHMGSDVKPVGTIFTPDVMFAELPISGG